MVLPNRSCSAYRRRHNISHKKHLRYGSSLTSSLGSMYSVQVVTVYQQFRLILRYRSATTHCPDDNDEMCGHLLEQNQTRLLSQR
jgi:hypothetical protein